MCGIFGLITKSSQGWQPHLIRRTIDELFCISESRGKEAAGIAALYGDTIGVCKQPLTSSLFIRSQPYRRLMNRALAGPAGTLALIGHARLVTDGGQELNNNNQPVVKDGVVGIHNGIIVNTEDLWEEFPELRRDYEVDSEVIMSLLGWFYAQTGSLDAAVSQAFRRLSGAASIAALFQELDSLVLATNNGSLYTCSDARSSSLIFASEEFFLRALLNRPFLRGYAAPSQIRHLLPNRAIVVNLSGDLSREFPFSETADGLPLQRRPLKRPVMDFSPPDKAAPSGAKAHSRVDIGEFQKAFDENERRIVSLRRCMRCILPETMPYIRFDAQGICNYCRTLPALAPKGRPALEQLVAPFRGSDGRADCIVGVSGGRDSTFGLHYIKTVLGMNPIAYTYDWGMITDLARRNISRICGKLGVEHMLVSADIPRKRRYIRMNVEAWLKKPELGIIPLFMAGDKQYFYHLNKLKAQTGIKLTFFCENPLERTDFKSGFCGVNQEFIDEHHVYTLSPLNKLKIAAYYLGAYLRNPAYINPSIANTLSAYACFYLIHRDYANIYRYIPWEEREIVTTLCNHYDWETAKDTASTWRIGDGTASFYNYIYYTVAGFSENETFRSNQIRQGALDRPEALRLARQDNRPRFESMRWYCDTIGIDFLRAMRIINSIPKRYNGHVAAGIRRE